MTRNGTVRQRDLFEADEPQTAPTHVQRERLAGLVEALLREIEATPNPDVAMLIVANRALRGSLAG